MAPGQQSYVQPFFAYNEIWVMNTEYRLFGEDGPRVSPEATHWSRLDECSKVVAVSPAHSSVRLFWADAVVSVCGPDLGKWMAHIGRKAPSEQQMAKFMWLNIEAASRGEQKTLSVAEASQSWDWDKGVNTSTVGQPTPGIFVWKTDIEIKQPKWGDSFPTEPTAERIQYFLSTFEPKKILGMFLDYGGALLRPFGTQPLSGDAGSSIESTITILGGPKGMAEPFKDVVKEAFTAKGIPLLTVCLGPEQQMAHACVAYLRLEADAGRLRPAMLDLFQLGRAGYEALFERVEADLLRASKKRRILGCPVRFGRS